MKSNYEYTKQRSKYHFDNSRRDQMGEWVHHLGRYDVTWLEELEYIKQHTRPLTWPNRKATLTGNPDAKSPHADMEAYDILQGGGNPNMELMDIFDDIDATPNIKALSKPFGLEQERFRINVQRTGQMFDQHIDKLDLIYPGVDPDKIVKLVIMLEDWEPGQFYIYGTYSYTHWKAGDVHWFDWWSTPHSTANASHKLRFSINITGIRTEQTDRAFADFEKYKGLV